jgi:hypothetical protein
LGFYGSTIPIVLRGNKPTYRLQVGRATSVPISDERLLPENSLARPGEIGKKAAPLFPKAGLEFTEISGCGAVW